MPRMIGRISKKWFLIKETRPSGNRYYMTTNLNKPHGRLISEGYWIATEKSSSLEECLKNFRACYK